ncbi:MAG: sulfotransferase family 2 domain-containing protein [Actinomycetota bacterium]
MSDKVDKGLNAARDAVARVAWLLPHDLRRRAYLRLRPELDDLYRTMRTKRLGEVPGLTVSLVPFEEHRCIFVHIPKNGGTSIGRSLFGDYQGNHMPIRSYQMIYSKADFEAYYKFAFVRNPFDRLLSGFRFAKNGADRVGDPRLQTGQTRELQDALAPYAEFEHFVSDWVTPANVRLFEHFRAQHRFVCSPGGAVQLDHVGRFETLADDFAVVAERLGVATDLMHDRRTKGPEHSSSYRDHYTPATRRIAESVFREDLERFDYTFDD